MLTIRTEQMGALSDYMLQAFKRRLAAHLRVTFPYETAEMDDPTLEGTIDAGMQRAREYDVRSEDDIRRFLECMFRYGPHFDTDPNTAWAGDILRRTDLGGSAKMDRVCEHRPQEAARQPAGEGRP